MNMKAELLEIKLNLEQFIAMYEGTIHVDSIILETVRDMYIKNTNSLEEKFGECPAFLQSIRQIPLDEFKEDMFSLDSKLLKKLVKALDSMNEVHDILFEGKLYYKVQTSVENFIKVINKYYNTHGLTVQLVMFEEVLTVTTPNQINLLVNDIYNITNCLEVYKQDVKLEDALKYKSNLNLNVELNTFSNINIEIMKDDLNEIQKESILNTLKFHVSNLLKA